MRYRIDRETLEKHPQGEFAIPYPHSRVPRGVQEVFDHDDPRVKTQMHDRFNLKEGVERPTPIQE